MVDGGFHASLFSSSVPVTTCYRRPKTEDNKSGKESIASIGVHASALGVPRTTRRTECHAGKPHGYQGCPGPDEPLGYAPRWFWGRFEARVYRWRVQTLICGQIHGYGRGGRHHDETRGQANRMNHCCQSISPTGAWSKTARLAMSKRRIRPGNNDSILSLALSSARLRSAVSRGFRLTKSASGYRP